MSETDNTHSEQLSNIEAKGAMDIRVKALEARVAAFEAMLQVRRQQQHTEYFHI